MALTVAALAGALRIGDGQTAPAEPQLGILNRLLAVSDAMVQRYAPDAPEIIRDEAKVRIAGYLYDSPPAQGRNLYTNAFSQSGAAALLEPWRGVSVLVFGQSDAVAAAAGTGGGGTPADQAAIDAAVDVHDTDTQAHRDLDYPPPTLGQVLAALGQGVGTGRLSAEFVRGIAEEIDRELGANTWRGGGAGQSGLTRSQVHSEIDDERPWVQIARVEIALPSDTTDRRAVIVDGVPYRLVSVMGAQTLHLTVGQSPDLADEDAGYVRDEYGELTGAPYIDQLVWDDDSQGLILRLRSVSAPGTISLAIPGHGTYPFADAGRTTYTVETAFGRQLFARAATNPFTAASAELTLTPQNPISHWQRDVALISDAGEAGLSLDQVAALITHHAAQPDVHHTPTPPVQNPFTLADEAKLDLYPDGGQTGNAGKLLGFDTRGNPTTVSNDGLNQTEVDERVQAAKGDTVPANTPGGPGAGSSSEWAPDDHDHGIYDFRAQDPLPSGADLTALPDGYLAFLDGEGVFEVAPTGMSSRGGLAGWIPTASPDGQSRGFSTRTGPVFGTRPSTFPATVTEFLDDDDNLVLLRATAGTIGRAGLRVSVGSQRVTLGYEQTVAGEDIFFGRAAAALWGTTAIAAGDVDALSGNKVFISTAKHWRLVLPVPDSRAGIEDGSIVPADLDIQGGVQTNRAVTLATATQFGTTLLAGQATVWSGNFPLLRIQANRTSAVAPINFDTVVDLDLYEHGQIAFDLTMTINDGAPDAVAWSSGGSDRVANVNGILSLDQIRASDEYDGSNHLGAEAIRHTLWNDDTGLGPVVVHCARTRGTNLLSANAQFVPGVHTLSDAINVQVSGNIFLMDAGVPRAIAGDQGPVIVVQDTLPTASDYADHTIAIVESGVSQGEWIKRTRITQGTGGLGLAGVNFDPEDYEVRTIGDRTYLYIARVGFSPPHTDGLLPAAGAMPSGAPADLAYVVLDYLTNTHDRGGVEYGFSSDQTAVNTIAWTLQNHAYAATREDARAWDTDQDLSAREVARLRAGVWQLSEPGTTNHRVAEEWERIAPAGTAALLTAGTDTAQRTWPANALAGLSGLRREVLYEGRPPLRPVYTATPTGTNWTFNRALTAADDNGILVISFRVTGADVNENWAHRMLPNYYTVGAYEWRTAAENDHVLGNGAVIYKRTNGVSVSSNSGFVSYARVELFY